jgi:hypothetical protein
MRPRKDNTFPIVFMDVDGVLNGHEHGPGETFTRIEFNAACNFNQILESTDSSWVLTSAWRYHVHSGRMTMEGLRWLFMSHWIPGDSLVGITRADTFPADIGCDEAGFNPPLPVPNERGQQITDWRTMHRHTGPYVVIDDMDLGITEAGHPFIQTDWKIGLTRRQADEAIEMLNGQIQARDKAFREAAEAEKAPQEKGS